MLLSKKHCGPNASHVTGMEGRTGYLPEKVFSTNKDVSEKKKKNGRGVPV